MTEGRDGQAGVVASQLAVLMPAVLLLVMLGVQFALWAHGTQLADAAADTAASTAALPGATAEQGRAAAAALLAQAGNLANPTITVQRDADRVTATVTGTAPQVVPGLPAWSVKASAVTPTETFVPEGQR